MRMCDFIIPTADKRKDKMCFRQPDQSVSINRGERSGEKGQRRSPEIEQGAEEEPGRDRKIQRPAI